MRKVQPNFGHFCYGAALSSRGERRALKYVV